MVTKKIGCDMSLYPLTAKCRQEAETGVNSPQSNPGSGLGGPIYLFMAMP